MKQLFLLLTFSLFSFCLSAQIITGMATKWSDDFRDWTIYTDVEDEEGSLTMRWQNQLDWSQWDYRLGESSGSIKTKFNNDLSQWEVRGDGEIIDIRMKWNNDVNEWTISDGSKKLTLKAAYNNNLNDWEIVGNKNGAFQMYMEWQDDPRNWIIEEELDEEISLPFKMAIAFIGIFQTIPK